MKNKFLKLASGLLVLCLMSTCAIGATFAKYTTGDSSADTARVAKWGVEVSTSGTLFGKAYQNVMVQDGPAATVQSKGGVDFGANTIENVVAPGTENTAGFQVKVFGTPEVDFTVLATTNGATIEDIYLGEEGKTTTYAVMVEIDKTTVTTLNYTDYYVLSGADYVIAENATADKYFKLMDVVTVTDVYYPIAWSVNGTATSKNFVDTVADIVNGINGNTTGTAKTYQANATVNDNYKITWAWAFGTNDVANEDTILGNIAAGANVVKYDSANSKYVAVVDGTDYNLDIVFGISVTATQVD